MKHQFIDKQFREGSLILIDQANGIIDGYQAQGYSLTLRQLYYQFVARDLIPNNMRSYKRLGSVLSDARLAGYVDWDAIEDRTRELEELNTYENASEIVRNCVYWFRSDRWENQEHRLEVWIEKEALVGVIQRICEAWNVPYFACRGYNSQSEQYKAGRRFAQYYRNGQTPVVIHLGDHDPSGINMTEDNDTRLRMFAQHRVEVKRIALNMDQVEEYNPPPNYAKESDSRYHAYCDEFNTTDCWELDALEPSVINDLIREQIDEYREDELWQDRLDYESEVKAELQDIADNLDSRGR